MIGEEDIVRDGHVPTAATPEKINGQVSNRPVDTGMLA
jgi:hypothetical protein